MGSVDSVILGWDLEESGGGKVVVGEHVLTVTGGLDPLVDHLLGVVRSVVIGNVLREGHESFWSELLESISEVVVGDIVLTFLVDVVGYAEFVEIIIPILK